jgi:hypothetical protein
MLVELDRVGLRSRLSASATTSFGAGSVLGAGQGRTPLTGVTQRARDAGWLCMLPQARAGSLEAQVSQR